MGRRDRMVVGFTTTNAPMQSMYIMGENPAMSNPDDSLIFFGSIFEKTSGNWVINIRVCTNNNNNIRKLCIIKWIGYCP
jgi:hypothetical protein